MLRLLNNETKAAQPLLQAGPNIAIVLNKQNTNDPISRLKQNLRVPAEFALTAPVQISVAET